MNHSFEWFFSVNRLAKIEWFIRESDWPCSSCYWVTCEVLSFIIKPSELDCAEDLTDGSRSKLEDQCSTYSKHISDMVTFSEIHMDLFMFLMLHSSWTPQLCNSNNTYANAILLEMHYWDMTWLITSPGCTARDYVSVDHPMLSMLDPQCLQTTVKLAYKLCL